MNDYRLDGLSPRLFEHLVQSLAYGSLTSTITPFGDGPDGGREATFEDKTHYGAEGNYWDGYGIIQAKYHVRPQDTRRDAAWARTQLTRELKQYTRKKNPRPAPEYYIFATNIVLSPGEGGGKDSVRSILKNFATTHNLKGFDLWDYDKIRVLLDNNKKVENSYLAWISTSDVLAQLSAALKTQQRDYYLLILKYLQRELVADQYAQLEQAGHSADDAIPLSQVFVDLPTTFRPASTEPDGSQEADTPKFVATIMADAGHSLRALAESATESPALPYPDSQHPDSQRKRRGRYVLIGGPGQGKTTIGQYVCQVFRCSLLRDVPSNRLSQDALNAIAGLTNRWNSDIPPEPRARRLPFRIVLGALAKSLASGETNSLMGYLAKKFSIDTDVVVSAEEIERILCEYPSVIVLDGLDEVPPSTNRDAVIAAVTNFSIDVATNNLDVMIIATSRPQGYSEEFSPQQYAHHYLMPLSRNVALQYGNQLAKIRFGANTDRSRKVIERLSRAVATPATARLMTTPLQVTILTLLVDRIGQPPEERWALFNAYYRLIFERETERDITSVAVLREHPRDVDAIHRRVGLALQVESERSGGTDALLTVKQFGQVVEDYLSGKGHEGQALHELKEQIIYAAANRLVFLVGLESGQVGFEIRSLQEFMAAEGLVDGPDSVVQGRLKQVAASSHWRNAFLFSAGKCFEQRDYLWDTIEAICFELNDDANDSFRRLLVGSGLALDLLEDGPARKQPNKRRSLTRLALELLQRPSSDSRRLADICHSDTRHIFLEKIKQELAGPGDLDTNLVAWRCLVFLIEHFGGEFEALGREVLGRRRLTPRAFGMAVDAATGRDQWLAEVLFEYLQESGPELDPFRVRQITRRIGVNFVQVGPWPISRYPEWLLWYAQYAEIGWRQRSEINLRITTDAKSPITLGVSSLRQGKHAGRLIPPDNLPSGRGWQFYRKVEQFTANPSAEALAEAVRSYIDIQDGARRIDFPIGNFPWPLLESILAAHENAEQVIQALDEGRFGDYTEWMELEQSFTEGVTLDYVTSLMPISGSRESGILYKFPFRTHAYYGQRSSWRFDSRQLVQTFDDSRSPVVRKFIAGLLLEPLMPRRRFDWVNRVLPIVTLLDTTISPIFFDLVPFVDLDDMAWSALFSDAPPSVFDLRYRIRNQSSLTTLWETIEARPTAEGLLVPIAVGIPSWDASVRRSMIHPVSLSHSASPAIRFAALLINIAAGARVGEIADDIRWALEQRSTLFNWIADAVIARELSYDDECSELLQLVSVASAAGSDSFLVLQRNFLRRQSRLSDREVWDRLRLPRGVLRILDLRHLI